MAGDQRNVSIVVKDQGSGPIPYAKWREGDRQVMRRLTTKDGDPARAWMVRKGDPEAKPNGREAGQWVDRRGTAPDGYLTVAGALARRDAAVDDRESEAEVKRLEAEAEAEAARRAAEARTVEDLAEAWMAWGSADDPHGDRDAWSYATQKNTRSYVGRIVRVLGEGRLVSSVTKEELREFLAALKPERNGETLEGQMSRSARSNYILALRGMFAFGKKQGWLDDDPAAGLRTPRGRQRDADTLARDQFLDADQVAAVVAAAGEYQHLPPARRLSTVAKRRRRAQQDAAMILVAAFTGLRQGELIALRWRDVDLARSSIHVRESHSLGQTGGPKWDSKRTVPMADEVVAALEKVQLRGHHLASGDLVFINSQGGHVDAGGLRERFKDACERAGVSPITWHGLRHTFGTVMASHGVPLRTIAGYMGHRSTKVTEIYAAFLPRHEDAAVVSEAFRPSNAASAVPV